MSFATISSKLIACSIGACRRQKSWMSGSLPPRVNCSARFRSVIYGTAAAGRVVKLVKLPAFRPYTRARAQPRITPQKYRSSPTSPRAAGWSIGPHETRGNPARHVVPSRVRRGGEYRSLRCPAAPRRPGGFALRNAARSPPPAPAGCRRRRARRRGRDGRRCADDGLGGQFRGHLAATLTRRSAMKVRHGWKADIRVVASAPGAMCPPNAYVVARIVLAQPSGRVCGEFQFKHLARAEITVGTG